MFLLLLAALSAFAQDRGARPEDAGFAAADDAEYVPAPKDRLWYSNATYARVNPLGLVDIYRIGWRRRLSTKDSILFQDTYTFVGPSVTATPAWARAGLYGEAQLLAVLRVFGQLDTVGYFGTFDQILGFDEADRFSDQAIADRGDEARATTGWIGTLGATARAKVGPIAIRNTAQVVHMDLALNSGTHFYDQLSDRLVRDGGWFAINDADVLYVSGKLRLGARHTFTDGLDGGSTEGEQAQHRVGPLFAWQFDDKAPGARFNQPTLFVVTQWWAQHPYRTGNEQSQGLPLIAVGFAFNGDYWTSK
jgi:hypothetical protein